MARAIRIAVFSVLVVIPAAVMSAAPADAIATVVVFPTGVYPTDVENVQAAVAGGGHVLLKATTPSGIPRWFNFGPSRPGSGFVTITKATELAGEHAGSANTTIRGGQYPIRGSGKSPVAVRDITFDSPVGGAVELIGPSLAEVTGNRILNIAGEPRGSALFIEAVVVAGGRAVVASNVLEGFLTSRSIGISQFDGNGSVEIVDNEVIGSRLIAIEASRNRGAVSIERNIVRPSAQGLGTGIEINGSGGYHVADNDVVISSPFGDGLFVFGAEGFGFGTVTNPIIERNRVEVQSSSSAITLGGLVFDGVVRDNDLLGSADVAIGTFAFEFNPGDQPSEIAFNTFVDNGLSHIDTTVADVVLVSATHDNVVSDTDCTYVDLGTNNVITGCVAVPPPPNDDFADAAPLDGPDGTITGTNVGATTEPAEPSVADQQATVWYEWQAPGDGVATFDTFGSDYDTVLVVYTGTSLATLDVVAANDDTAGSGQSRVTFPTDAGTVYWIAVGGYRGSMGDFVLSWRSSAAVATADSTPGDSPAGSEWASHFQYVLAG